MAENANVELRTSNVERPSEESNPPLTSKFDVRSSTFDVRIFLQLLTILLVGLFIYGIWLGDSPLYRTEPFRALVADRMAHGGSWLIPHLYGEVYLRKPPLIYWVQATVQKLMGRGDEFVWRLPSAVGSALLAVFIAWWSARWFGRAALLPAGFASLALITLWDQDRGADIDALNTAFAIVSAACVLELLYGIVKWTSVWTIALGLGLGATLLLKGPGGLPQVIAAMIGPAILMRDWRPLRRRALPILIGGLIGAGIFAAYVVAVKIQMHRQHIAPDQTGVYEVIEKSILHSWISRLISLGIPFALLAYALPVSLALPFAIALIRKMPAGDPQRCRALAILGTLAATAFIWILDGNDNPRYEYVMLPLLAPLVGYVWVNRNQDRPSRYFDLALLGAGALLCGGFAIFWSQFPPSASLHRLMDVALTACLVIYFSLVAVFLFSRPLGAKAASPVMVVLLLLVALPMAQRKNLQRQLKSAKNGSLQLRAIIGNSRRVSAAGLVKDLPELFYYAHVDVDSYSRSGLAKLAAARGGHWVVLAQTPECPAYEAIASHIPNAFPRGAVKLNMPDPRDVIYVGWYDPPPGADTRIQWNVQNSAEPED